MSSNYSTTAAESLSTEAAAQIAGDDDDGFRHQQQLDDDHNKDSRIINNDGIIPKRNRDYECREYWEERFSQETEYEWLLSFDQLRGQLLPLLLSPMEQQTYYERARILVVGCGNSPFSADLYDAGFHHIVNIDYSETVIEHMRSRNQLTRPEMQWLVMDMTDLSELEDESFDLVLDKAAMDTLLTHEGDVWNPNAQSIQAARSMCRHISRVLRPGGIFVQVSLIQPHFRKKYLLGLHDPPPSETLVVNQEAAGFGDENNENIMYSKEFGWTLRIENAGEQAQDGSSIATSSFGYFWYEMTKTKNGEQKRNN